MKNHPLFPDHPDADIESIHVTRFQDGGKKWCHTKFAPDEMNDLSRVFERFGGGRYEFVGHGKTQGKAGKPGFGIIARQEISLDGSPLPLNPESAGTAKPVEMRQASPFGGGSELGALIGLIGTLIQSSQQATNQLLLALVQRPKEDHSPMVAMVQQQTEMLKVLLGKIGAPAPAAPAPAAAPPGKAGLTMGELTDAIEWYTSLQKGLVEGMQASGAAGGGEMGLNDMLAAIEKGAEVVSKVRKVADEGKPVQAAQAAIAETFQPAPN